MTTAKKKPRLSPVSQLRGVLTVLDGKAKIPTAELLGSIREMVGDALAVLQEPDRPSSESHSCCWPSSSPRQWPPRPYAASCCTGSRSLTSPCTHGRFRRSTAWQVRNDVRHPKHRHGPVRHRHDHPGAVRLRAVRLDFGAGWAWRGDRAEGVEAPQQASASAAGGGAGQSVPRHRTHPGRSRGRHWSEA